MPGGNPSREEERARSVTRHLASREQGQGEADIRVALGIDEVRGAGAFDLLQALNTGHLGSLTTIHANAAEQALTRLAHCVLTATVGLPHRSVREAIALAIHLVVHLARVEGRRVVTEVAAVRGYDQQADRFVVECAH